MNINSDQLRRDSWDTKDDQTRAVRGMREILARLFGDTSVDAGTKGDLILPAGVNRRKFLQIGGLTVASAAVFAACGSDDEESTNVAGDAGDSDTGEGNADGKGSAGDIRLLRTASSLEELAVDVYQQAIDSGLVKTAAIGDAAKLFQAQHKEHSELLQGATKKLGGDAFDKANPVVLQQLEPTISALKDEMGVLKLAYDLEKVAAATYFSSVGGFTDLTLNQAAMSIGGVEARHVAILGSIVAPQTSPPAFLTKDGAVAVGTGV
jgi:hypothetical protein